ncbi:MAG: ThiF family adenylyltransferase [Planctomycetota bacterium]
MSRDRYARQRQFPPIGDEGQRRLEASDVTVLGCGALGTVASELLCRAGVGRIRIIDRDVVEWTNLQRQSLFDTRDAEQGNCKADAACRRLSEINDAVELAPLVVDVTPDNIVDLLDGTDLVVDACDNFGLRFLLNDWALATGSVWVHGGCVGAQGQLRLFDGSSPPCFRCLVPTQPAPAGVETCDTAGVIGSATSAVASLQVTEAIKWLSGNQELVSADVLSIDFWTNRIRQIKLDDRLAPDCVACRERRFEYLHGDALPSGDTTLCGRDTVQIQSRHGEVDLTAVSNHWQSIGRVKKTRFFARLELDEVTQLTLFRDGRILVQGTDDLARARSLADRFVGS